MKILFIGREGSLIFATSIKNSFRHLGNTVIDFAETDIEHGYTQFQAQKIIDEENRRYIEYVENNKIDFVFTVNTRHLKREFFEFCKTNKVRLYQYLVDSIRWQPVYMESMGYYDNIFSYEPTDENVEFRSGKYVHFVPLGCDSEVYFPIPNRQHRYDILFVGDLDKRRLTILESIAKNAKEKGYRMAVYTMVQIKKLGKWKNIFKYISRQVRYRIKYPNLMKVIVNEGRTGADLAELYNVSKICINIHVGKDDGMHTGPNLRVFEVAGCGSFELIDKGHLAGTQYEVEQDIVEVEDNEWNSKVDYYLRHEEERKKIALNGYLKTRKYHTMDCVVKEFLDCIAEDLKILDR